MICIVFVGLLCMLSLHLLIVMRRHKITCYVNRPSAIQRMTAAKMHSIVAYNM